MADVKAGLIEVLKAEGRVEDSEKLAVAKGWDHDKLVGVIKSLLAEEQVTASSEKREGWKLTAEGEEYLKSGSPEVRVFDFVKSKGSVPNPELEAALGQLAKIGMGTAMKNKWVSMDKATKAVTPVVDSVKDEVREDLKSLGFLGKDKTDSLKKRKLVTPTSLTAFKVETTANFGAEKAVADITADMILKGTWASTNFKSFNFENASGIPCTGGHLHPLNKMKTEIRTVLMLMGFEEMKTNQWVESSFWNFDTLFQPQQHPARDAHDTFFIETPARAQNIPAEYMAEVKKVHEEGGYGSTGWRYDWSEDEAHKNLLRTHTTAVSARTLYQLAKDYKATGVFKPKKYFSIDRVFRNETLDATHLAEFHQVEGLIADRNIGLPHLIGTFRDFFSRMGLSKLRFKPAYNPYTEPSMEIFGFHPTLKRWVEVGNSGVFRPEMIQTMGLPEDVSVIAWGIGLERVVAQQFNVRHIKDLFSAQQDVAATKKFKHAWLRRVEAEDKLKA